MAEESNLQYQNSVQTDEGKKTGIISYGAGNIFSLTAALERQNIPFGMIYSPEEFDQYDRYIIPGVGHAGAAMQKLEESRMIEKIKSTSKPVLGICVGMQLLTDFSEEGNAHLLSIAPLRTRHFDETLQIKVPHTGWNKVCSQFENELFNDIKDGTYFYFVHSYFIEFNPTFTLAFADYGVKFSAALKKNNFYGVQFHPEKSGEAGEKILKNFSEL
ncbi:imidazole glycerol phosphate synthase subunit HisH [Pararcticibacter amylolyticus]|uniref:Imidazole glycerol phosphate synthase subunit HisH n=1 Tax=Pararcticibacter amylolyticus TaxID=2173175 RepID=A0A2U2PJW6_9SPHI|nr:imidazole glycerol phosphate synthase subunit HisH [Pararcticibacter amylolyticus]PWG81693.1 imidazole glycerol phosphate synthase subunit HisH [Pararcticibacter amylolyticus]